MATKIIEDKVNEKGLKTVEPLLSVDGAEQPEKEGEEETKDAVAQDVGPKKSAKDGIKISTSQLKKAKKARDKALKDIFAYEGRYNLKFLAQWSQTHNFKKWLETHDNSLLSALSPQSPPDEDVTVTIHYENGDYYKG